MNTKNQINCFIFYFDLIGVVDAYLADPSILDRVVEWQCEVRGEFSMMEENTTCKTLNDNVWARITSAHPESDMYTVLDFAGATMNLASRHGFKEYFGVITYGDHTFDLKDRTLSSGIDATDITVQHIDSLSGPHIRAAFAEKWSAMLAKQRVHPCPNSVWVSEEVLFGEIDIADVIRYSGIETKFNAPGIRFDLKDSTFTTSKVWPFNESKFQAITIR